MAFYPRRYLKNLYLKAYNAIEAELAKEVEFNSIEEGFWQDATVVTSAFDYLSRKVVQLGTVFSVRALGNYYYVNKVVDYEALRNALFWGSSRIEARVINNESIASVGALVGFQETNRPLSYPAYYINGQVPNISGAVYGSLGETRPERMYFTIIQDYVAVGEGQTPDYENTELTILQAGSIAQLMETVSGNAPPQPHAISTNISKEIYYDGALFPWIGSYIDIVELGELKGMVPYGGYTVRPEHLGNTGIYIRVKLVYESGGTVECTDTSTFEILDAPFALLTADNELVINELADNLYSFHIRITNPAVDDPVIILVDLRAFAKNDPYSPGGTSGPGGGGGSYGQGEGGTSPGAPDGSAEADLSAAGFYTRYVMDASTLGGFGGWLWDINLGLVAVKEVVGLIYGDPASSIISIMSFPFNITSLTGPSTRSGNIYWGSFNTKLAANILVGSAGTIDWGTIDIKEYWGNFLDYAPHTKIELYLPWCSGFISIDPNECMNGRLSVKTNVELAKGTCVHNVSGRGGVIASVSGVCATQIPVTALDSSGKALNLVTAAVATGVSVANGLSGANAGYNASESFRKASFNKFPIGDPKAMSQYTAQRMAAMSAAQAPYQNRARAAGKLAAASAVAALRVPGSVSRNGSFSNAGAGLGVQVPYVIISRPTQSIPDQYGHYYGYPSNIYASMGTLRGYTEIGEVHLDGLAITESEKNELDSILKGGVIF